MHLEHSAFVTTRRHLLIERRHTIRQPARFDVTSRFAQPWVRTRPASPFVVEGILPALAVLLALSLAGIHGAQYPFIGIALIVPAGPRRRHVGQNVRMENIFVSEHGVAVLCLSNSAKSIFMLLEKSYHRIRFEPSLFKIPQIFDDFRAQMMI